MHYLDRNEYQFELPPRCIEILQNSPSSLLTHYSRSFERNAKSTITERIAKIFNIPEENILLGYGCEDLLTQLVHYFIKQGDGILVAQHAWWYYKKIADEVSGVTLEFPMYKDEFSFRVNVNDILTLYNTHHPKIILIANPNNPTGDMLSNDDLETLIRHCPQAMMLIDESYWGYHEKQNAHLHRFLKLYPNIVILRTFSKYYGLAGVRIGFGFIHQKHEQFINFSKRYLGFNRLSEELALAALDSADHYEAMSRLVENEKLRYYSELRSLSGVRVYDSKANFVLISVPSNVLPKLKANFKKANILVRFFENNGLENHFRISIAKPEINSLVFQCIKDAVSLP